MYRILLITEDKMFTVADVSGQVLKFPSEAEAWVFIKAYALHKSNLAVAVEQSRYTERRQA